MTYGNINMLAIVGVSIDVCFMKYKCEIRENMILITDCDCIFSYAFRLGYDIYF